MVKPKDKFDEVMEILNTEKKKKGRPRKNPQVIEPTLEIDEKRFKDERGRVISYLEKLSAKKIGPSELISILEDLSVITNVNNLSKDEVIKQLRDLLNTIRG